MDVIALGAGAGAAVVSAIKDGHITCLLCDRYLSGGGVEVEFFGERTMLPAGPATLALAYRRAAAADRGVLPAETAAMACAATVPAERRGQACATTSPGSPSYGPTSSKCLSRPRPDQWHLLQPNWPSDYAALGRPCPSIFETSQVQTRRNPLAHRHHHARTACRCRAACKRKFSRSAARCASKGHDARVLGPCDGPPPDASVTPLGNSMPTAANGSVAPIAPDPSAQLRTIRALRDEEFDVFICTSRWRLVRR